MSEKAISGHLSCSYLRSKAEAARKTAAPSRSRATDAGVGGNKFVAFGRTLRRDPAREFEPACLESYAQTIFVLKPRGEDIELQGADDARDCARSVVRQNELDNAFLGHLAQSRAQLLRLHGIASLDPAERSREQNSGSREKSRSSPSVKVSPMRNVPWLGIPTTSRG